MKFPQPKKKMNSVIQFPMIKFIYVMIFHYSRECIASKVSAQELKNIFPVFMSSKFYCEEKKVCTS